MAFSAQNSASSCKNLHIITMFVRKTPSFLPHIGENLRK
jgi:hypothetical protein